MTVSTLTFYKVYVATAGQTEFPYDFLILAADDLKVYVNGVAKTFGVDYTVSGAGSAAGGNATLVVGASAGDVVLVRRQTPRTQATDLTAGGKFYEDTIEGMADKLTLLLQESSEAILPLSPGGYYLKTKTDGTGIEAVSAIGTTTTMPFDTGAAPPTTGTWATGFIRFNSAPAAGGNLGWVCILGGTPGTWYEFGFISANPVV